MKASMSSRFWKISRMFACSSASRYMMLTKPRRSAPRMPRRVNTKPSPGMALTTAGTFSQRAAGVP